MGELNQAVIPVKEFIFYNKYLPAFKRWYLKSIEGIKAILAFDVVNLIKK